MAVFWKVLFNSTSSIIRLAAYSRLFSLNPDLLKNAGAVFGGKASLHLPLFVSHLRRLLWRFRGLGWACYFLPPRSAGDHDFNPLL